MHDEEEVRGDAGRGGAYIDAAAAVVEIIKYCEPTEARERWHDVEGLSCADLGGFATSCTCTILPRRVGFEWSALGLIVFPTDGMRTLPPSVFRVERLQKSIFVQRREADTTRRCKLETGNASALEHTHTHMYLRALAHVMERDFVLLSHCCTQLMPAIPCSRRHPLTPRDSRAVRDIAAPLLEVSSKRR